MAALQKAMKVGNEEIESVAENNEIDEDTGEIVLGVSAEDEVIEEINSED
jgi:chaperonin cofactor prefoldin